MGCFQVLQRKVISSQCATAVCPNTARNKRRKILIIHKTIRYAGFMHGILNRLKLLSSKGSSTEEKRAKDSAGEKGI